MTPALSPNWPGRYWPFCWAEIGNAMPMMIASDTPSINCLRMPTAMSVSRSRPRTRNGCRLKVQFNFLRNLEPQLSLSLLRNGNQGRRGPHLANLQNALSLFSFGVTGGGKNQDQSRHEPHKARRHPSK